MAKILATLLKKNCGQLMHQSVAPRVITQEMLYKAVEEQGPQGEAGRLYKEDGIELDEVKHLSLAFRNILVINGVSLLKNLTKLSLNNNMIEKIENIDILVHLKELNLSFNYIKEIENMDHLIELEDLTLCGNKISEIKNMGNLKSLVMFSIGKNEIRNRKTFIHLRQLKKLIALDLEGNPCFEGEGFEVYVLAFLPQLEHLNYRRIDTKKREEGEILYKKTLTNIIKEETILAEQQAEAQKKKDDNEFYSKCFVEYLDDRQLFDSLFENDSDGNLLLNIPEVQTLYKEYEEEFLELTKKMFEMGKEKYKIRNAEIVEFFDCVEEGKKENQKTSQDIVENFLAIKDETLEKIKTEREFMPTHGSDIVEQTDKLNSITEDFINQVEDIWSQLMEQEINLFEQLAETNLFFERNLTELINNLIEEAQGLFTFCRGLEQNYMEQVSSEASRMMALYNMKEDIEMVPELRALMEDKEILNNAIAASHDIHMQLIDSREDRLVSRSRSWLNDFVEVINKGEIQRNRMKVLEINHFLQCQLEEMEVIQNEGPYFDADISAALGN